VTGADVSAVGCYDLAGTNDGKDYFQEVTSGIWFISYDDGADAWFLTTDINNPDSVPLWWQGQDPPGMNNSPNGIYWEMNLGGADATVSDG
jgi:hypothetical protein